MFDSDVRRRHLASDRSAATLLKSSCLAPTVTFCGLVPSLPILVRIVSWADRVLNKGETRRRAMKFQQRRSLMIALCVTASIAHADSLELKNGSLINGKFMGGTSTEITFQVGS